MFINIQIHFFDMKVHGKMVKNMVYLHSIDVLIYLLSFSFYNEGFGKLIFADGSYYQGEFANNEIMGQGTRYFASSRNTYTGHFYYGISIVFLLYSFNITLSVYR